MQSNRGNQNNRIYGGRVTFNIDIQRNEMYMLGGAFFALYKMTLNDFATVGGNVNMQHQVNDLTNDT